MVEIFTVSFKNIYRKLNKMVFTILGIAIGVASVIVISCISVSGTTAVNSELNNLGLGGFVVSANTEKVDVLTEEDVNIIRENSKIETATPVLIQPSKVSSNNLEDSDSIVWGIDSNANKTISLNLKYGRFITKEDIVNKSKICMVDVNFANKLYKRDNITGKKITVKMPNSYEDYLVVGVLETGGQLMQSAMGSVVSNFLYAPYTSVQNDCGIDGYQQIITKVNSEFEDDIDLVSSSVVKQLDNNAGVKEGYTSMNLAKQKDVLLNILDILTLVLTAVGAVSLVVASLSIMTVMLVSVSERTKEIGIKKSIGANKKMIVCEFLVEAVIISLTGCIVGILIGVGISYVGGIILNTQIELNIPVIIFTMIFSVVSGVVFGVYPAIKASSLQPVKALRFD